MSRQTHTIGGKAQGLVRLQEAGFRVPLFLVIPAELFDPVLAGLPTDDAGIALRRERLRAFVLPDAEKNRIRETLAGWSFPACPVVVRSSVADEDGETNAFAGLMDSFLNLKTLNAVYEKVVQCTASAYSERAVAYRQQKGLSLAARPALIIQQQVAPVVSGVLFTTSPDYPQEMAVHAVPGFGEGLVSGQLDPDEFYPLKTSGMVHRRVVVPDRQDNPCLTNVQLADLFALGQQIETAFGRPQDVEFVVNEQGLFVVQARPITQPIPEVIVYDNSNIQESYCGVTTPLTFSFASRAYATVYQQTMKTLGLPDAKIRAQEDLVTNLLGLVKGRIYYNINNWYRGLQLLPSFRQNKADMERMMGLDEPVDFVQDTKKTPLQALQMLPGLLTNLARLVWAFGQLKKAVPAFHNQFQSHYKRFYTVDLGALNPAQLLDQKAQLDRDRLGNWSTPIINDFYVMMTNGRAIRQLRRAGIAQPDEFLSRYLSGDKQIESTQPVRAMQHLADLARQQPDLFNNLKKSDLSTLHAAVKTRFPAFYEAVNAFIDQYGDRTVGELKLETVTMRLNPAIFYQYLRNYLTAPETARALPETESRLHREATDELAQLLTRKSFWFRQSTRRVLERLQQAIRYRESMRLERTRLFGMYRALYLAMGAKLTRTGQLASPRDVFYLTETEITDALNGYNSTHLADLIITRKAEFARYETDDVPSRVVIPSPPTNAVAPPERPNQLQGTGCVSGEITGEVIVITDPRDSLDVTGKIVCALRTDPGWAVLFPTCLAVLIEKGSSLSHSVILLRELGIPTIINISGLTKTLSSGQVVMMNGRTGEIKIK